MATQTARSASSSDVNDAINGNPNRTDPITGLPYAKLQHGDICKIPAGNLGAAAWPSVVTVNRNISILGNGIGQTVLTGGLFFNITATSRIAATGVPDSHRIHVSGMTWTRATSAYSFRIQGACPIDEANATNPALSGGFEVDHILINATTIATPGFIVDLYGWPEGVFHHIVWDLDPNQAGQHFVTNHSSSPDGTGGFGDYSWSSPSSVGTIHQVYVEDSICKRSGSFECNINSSAIAGGARYACRHIACWGSAGGGHESRSDGGLRLAGGLRSAEAYKNLYIVPGTAKNQSQTTAVRSGEGVHWGNRHNRFGGAVDPALHQHGLFAYVNGAWNTGPWSGAPNNPGTAFGGADGANPWDLNANGNLTNINGVAGNNFTAISTQNVADTNSSTVPTPNLSSIYAQGNGSPGQALSRDANNDKIIHVDATLPGGMATDRWLGFIIRNLDTQPRDSLSPVSFGFITGNSANTFTIQQSNEPNDAVPGHAAMQFNIASGQRWEIRRVIQCYSTVGCGSMTSGHPDNSTQGGFMHTNAVRLTDGTRRWADCDAPGCSQWDNRYRLSNDPTPFTLITTWSGMDKYLGALVNPRNTPNHPGYFYDGSVPAGNATGGPGGTELRPGTRVGPDAAAWALAPAASFGSIAGTQNGTFVGGPVLYTDGIGGYTYPHPFVAVGPRFTSLGGCTFATNGDTSQQFTVTTAGFTGTVTITRTGTAVPGLTFASTPGPNATATFTGQPTSGAGSPYTQHLKATSAADGDILQDLDITVLDPDQPPSIDTFTLSSGPYVAPATITLTATVSDDHGIVSVGFYEGSNLINQEITTPPYTTTWTNVTAGPYSLTVKATDTASPANVTQSSPAKNITVTPAAGLQPPTIVVSAGTGGTPTPPVSATKKILHWQATNNNRISAVVTNKTYIDTLPFDGLVLSVPSYQNLVGLTDIVNYTNLTNEVHPIQGALANVTHNYLDIMPGNSGMQDPFDSWTQTVANFVTVARVCQEQGLEGMFFDNEEYNIHWWTYPTDVAHAGSHTEAAYQAEWRARGVDVMNAILAQWPQAKIVHAIGPNRSVNTAPFSGAFSGSSHWLGGYFFAGMFEAAPTGNHVISGGELYYLRTATHFSTTKSFLDTIYTQNSALFSSSSVNPIWLANDDLSWGIYDQDTGNPVAVNGGVPMTSAILQTVIQNAVPNADEFVWNYSESGLEWLTPGGGSVGAWQDAIRAARTILGI